MKRNEEEQWLSDTKKKRKKGPDKISNFFVDVDLT